MGGEWVDTKLGDVLTLKRGYDLPTQDRQPGPFPVVSSSGITGSHIKAKAKGPGVVTGRYGTLGEIHFLTEDYWPLNTTLYVKDFKGNDPRFIAYFLKGINFASYSDKSSVPGINRNHLHSEVVYFPTDITEQRTISNILGSLDDKIELNRQMNRTLEAMARAIFKAWFVDFEPVKAKAAGATSFRGMPQDVFNQLPSRLTESELGPVPEWWEVGELGRVMEHPRRTIRPAELDEATPYIGLEHMPQKSIALTEWGRVGSVTSSKHKFDRGELLFGKLRPYFHKVGIAPVDGACSTDVVVIRPKSPEWYGYVLGHISSNEFVSYTTAASTGTKMPRTNWGDMSRYKVVLPTPNVAHAYSAVISPLADWIVAGIHEARSLAAIRDTLLPKLISGELRVKDAGQFVGAAQ